MKIFIILLSEKCFLAFFSLHLKGSSVFVSFHNSVDWKVIFVESVQTHLKFWSYLSLHWNDTLGWVFYHAWNWEKTNPDIIGLRRKVAAGGSESFCKLRIFVTRCNYYEPRKLFVVDYNVKNFPTWISWIWIGSWVCYLFTRISKRKGKKYYLLFCSFMSR